MVESGLNNFEHTGTDMHVHPASAVFGSDGISGCYVEVMVRLNNRVITLINRNFDTILPEPWSYHI